MSAISSTSTTAGNLLSYLAELNQQSQAASAPANTLLASEAQADRASQAGQVPQSNILAAIGALSPFNSALQQNAGTQDSLTSFLGSLEQNDPSTLGNATGAAANSTTSTSADLSAIANSNDTASQQAAISQLLNADGINTSQLQMDFLTAVLGSSNPSSATNGTTGDIFSDLSQDAATDSPLNILA